MQMLDLQQKQGKIRPRLVIVQRWKVVGGQEQR
jgi:hypothetical protein